MNLYLQNAGLLKTIKHFSKVAKAFPDEQFAVTLFSDRGVSKALLLYLMSVKVVSELHVFLKPKFLSRTLIKIANRNKRVHVHIEAEEKLTPGEWNKISEFTCAVCVEDFSGSAENQKFFAGNRNVIVKSKFGNDILRADMYQIMAYREPLYQCHFSSCLGKTMYVDSDSKIYFCPYHKAESSLGSLSDIDSAWEAEPFESVLENAVNHREECKASCENFMLCKGGCPFEDDCAIFKSEMADAKKELNEILENNLDLSTLPLFKENGVLCCLSKRATQKDCR